MSGAAPDQPAGPRGGPAALRRVAVLVVAGASLLSAHAASGTGVSASTAGRFAKSASATSVSATSVSATAQVPTVVAVGDIACATDQRVSATRCRHHDTARLARAYRPSLVLALGDLQYRAATLREFQSSYRRSWGKLKRVTRPVPGNHEYKSRGAAGYYAYFRRHRSPGYYAFDVGGWRIYALNSNCSDIDCRAQVRWLRQDMGANSRTCSAIMMHHPRYSSGEGEKPSMRRFWRVAYRYDVDLALAGHDHHYERFRRMDADHRRARDGIESFVVGTGGKDLIPLTRKRRGSVARVDTAFGVLALRLGAGGYAFGFTTTRGRIVDSGVRSCR